MSANHPRLSAECQTPFKCAGCVGIAWDEETQTVVDCEHFCHNQGNQGALVVPKPPPGGAQESKPVPEKWISDRYQPEVWAKEPKELVDA